MKRALVALVLAIAAMLAALPAAGHIKRLLDVSSHIDVRMFGSVVVLAMGVVLTMVWRLVMRKNELASSMLSPKPKLQFVYLLIAIGTTALSAIVAVTYTGFTPNWAHWDVAIASKAGLKELFRIWVGAFTEEALDRYVILGTAIVCCRSVFLGLLISTAAFTLGHPGADHFYIAAGGLWFGAIAISTGSIWPAVAAHFATNVGIWMLFRIEPSGAPVVDRVHGDRAISRCLRRALGGEFRLLVVAAAEAGSRAALPGRPAPMACPSRSVAGAGVGVI